MKIALPSQTRAITPGIAPPEGSQASWLQEKPIRLPMPERAEMLAFIRSFYQEVLKDELIGPIFQRVVGSAEQQWGGHYETMADFWLAVVFDGPAFRGNPMIKHAAIADIAPEHFARWLEIFERIACSFWPAPAASVFLLRARQIAPALIAGITRAREKQLVSEFH
jgi:hemoglobin